MKNLKLIKSYFPLIVRLSSIYVPNHIQGNRTNENDFLVPKNKMELNFVMTFVWVYGVCHPLCANPSHWRRSKPCTRKLFRAALCPFCSTFSVAFAKLSQKHLSRGYFFFCIYQYKVLKEVRDTPLSMLTEVQTVIFVFLVHSVLSV